MFFLLRALRRMLWALARGGRRRRRRGLRFGPSSYASGFLAGRASAHRPPAPEKVSTIGGRVVADTEAYAALLDLYEEYVGLLGRLERTRHAYDGGGDAAVWEKWSASRGRVVESIGSVTAKLDVLEVRNPGIAAGDLVGRRARLAEREGALGGTIG